MNKSKQVEYCGFESIMDFDEDWVEILKDIVPNGEYQGTVKITFEYTPSQEEEDVEYSRHDNEDKEEDWGF